jgi:hypothetical protein
VEASPPRTTIDSIPAPGHNGTTQGNAYGGEKETPMNQDLEQLRLLAIFHYIVTGLSALLACFPVLHLAVG